MAKIFDFLKLKRERIKDVNKRDKYGMTSLMWASAKGDTQEVERLVREGAEVNAQDNLGRTALMYACGAPIPDIKN